MRPLWSHWSGPRGLGVVVHAGDHGHVFGGGPRGRGGGPGTPAATVAPFSWSQRTGVALPRPAIPIQPSGWSPRTLGCSDRRVRRPRASGAVPVHHVPLGPAVTSSPRERG